MQQVTTAYLSSVLGGQEDAWSQTRASLQDDPSPLGRLESK